MDAADEWLAAHDPELQKINTQSSYGQRKLSSAADEFLAAAGYDEKGRQQEAYKVEQAANRATNRELAKSANIAIQMAEQGNAIRGMAKYVDGLKDVFEKMVPIINEAAVKTMDIAAEEAIKKIEEQRRRSPRQLRPRYEQRPPHLLENAVKEAVTIEEVGQGAVLAGFDEDKLDELTSVGSKSGKGYWRAYEFGRRFVMPNGVWRGPDGRYVKAQKGRNDAFYISKGTLQQGRRGEIWAYDPKMGSLQYGYTQAEIFVTEYLREEAGGLMAEFLTDAAANNASTALDTGSTGGGGSVGGVGET